MQKYQRLYDYIHEYQGLVYDFYSKFERERKEKGINVKGISPSDIREKFEGRDIKKILFVDFPIITNISVFKDRVMITMWEDDQISFLILLDTVL